MTTSPYSLDACRNRGYDVQQVAFSGGRSSAYMLLQILEANGGLPDDGTCQVTFQNTSRETSATYDFVERVMSETGVNIKWLEYECLAEGETEFDPPPPEPDVGDYAALAKNGAYHAAVEAWLAKPLQKARYKVVTPATAKRNGEVFDMLLRYNGILPSWRSRFCTRMMKVGATDWYMSEMFAGRPGTQDESGNTLHEGNGVHASAIGIRADESRRVFRASDDAMPKSLSKAKREAWAPRWAKGDSKEWYRRDLSAMWLPMYQAGVRKEDIERFWSGMHYDLDLPMLHGKTIGSNCKGCFNHSELEHYAYVNNDRADAWKWLCREHWFWLSRKQTFFTFSQKFPMRQVFEDADNNTAMNERIMSIEGFACQKSGECVIDDDELEDTSNPHFEDHPE